MSHILKADREPHTQTFVSALPYCDVCRYEEGKTGVLAHYDAKTTSGPWANLCDRHFGTHGMRLGLGYGQELILECVDCDGTGAAFGDPELDEDSPCFTCNGQGWLES